MWPNINKEWNMLEESREARERDMMTGYMDGFRDTRSHRPHGPTNHSEAYCFGWDNGRDDRMKSPRAPAETLHAEAELILRGEPPKARRRVGAAVAAALVLGGLVGGCEDVPRRPNISGKMIGTVAGCEVWRVEMRRYPNFSFAKCPVGARAHRCERSGQTEVCLYHYAEDL